MKPCALCGHLPPRKGGRPRKTRINRLYADSVHLLEHEIHALSVMSQAEGKLPDNHAKRLIDYVKLLSELNQVNKLESESKSNKTKKEPKNG